MRSLKIAAVEIIGIILLATVAAAQVAPAPVKGQFTTTVTRQPSTRGVQSMIHGKVVDIDSNPLPNVGLRLRNLKTGTVEQKGTSNQLGEFSFATQPEVPYVVEIADQTNRTIAVGDVVTTHAGEVASTLVMITARLPSVAGVFGETLGSVISAAAGTGITALQLSASAPPPPASPEQ